MIEQTATLSNFQMQLIHTTTKDMHQQSYSLKNGVKNLGEHLANEKCVEHDKETFTQLLRLIVSEYSSRRQTINLDTNQELSRLIPILCSFFSPEELVELVGDKLTNDMLHIFRLEILQNMFLERELEEVLQAFNSASIPLILIKGPVLAHTIYPEAHLRTYHDIDTLIQPCHIDAARKLLTHMGYVFYNEYRADAFDEQRTGYNYSLKQDDIPFPVLIELHTAPHSSEIGALFQRDELWKNAKTITLFGQQVKTMSPNDHLLYLCWHYRFHGFTRLLWLYDLVMMLRTYGDEIDWDALIYSAQHQHMGASLYYCFSWCRDLFGVAIPDSVFATLRPPLLSRLIVERSAMHDVVKALTFADYKEQRILARRAMVDSNTDLFKACLRMFFPSPIALQKRYMDHSNLPLQLYFLYYLVHPWITLAKGVRNLRRQEGNVQDKKER